MVCLNEPSRNRFRKLLELTDELADHFDGLAEEFVVEANKNVELRTKLATAEADTAELRVRLDLAQQRITAVEAERVGTTSNATGDKR